MTTGPVIIERAVAPTGTSVTFTGITSGGDELSTTYSWDTRAQVFQHVDDAEAAFRQRLTALSTPQSSTGRHVGRCGRWTWWMLTGVPTWLRPRMQLKAMRNQRRRALLVGWLRVAFAVHVGDR